MLGGGEVDFCVPSFADRHESANTRRPKCLFACPKSVECMWHRPARTETIASPSIDYDHAHQSATINRRSSPLRQAQEISRDPLSCAKSGEEAADQDVNGRRVLQ
jgi:hypothetical protein